MVFGNRDARSATGVCFSRSPATGEPGLFGEFLVDAQGEDVVAGTRTPEQIDRMRDFFPVAYDELEHAVAELERHYRDVQDVEFTVEHDRLFLLQTRSAKRTAAAALRAAVAFVDEGLISPQEAVQRIDPLRSSSCSIRRSIRRSPSRSPLSAWPHHPEPRVASSCSTPTTLRPLRRRRM